MTDSKQPKGKVTILRAASDKSSPPPQQESGCLKGCFWIMAIILLGITGVSLVIVLMGGETINALSKRFEEMLVPEPSVNVTSSQTIVTNIQAMGQLVSISAQMAKADIDVDIRQGVLGANSFTTKHVAQGTIEAGIDLTLLTAESVKHDALTDSYTITLPAAGLTSCRVDYIRQYDYSGTVLPVDRDEARLLANHTALLEFRDDALEGDILGRAEQQAALVFDNVIETITNRPVEVIFSDEEPALPPSCEPDIPGDWTYDPATKTWTRPE